MVQRVGSGRVDMVKLGDKAWSGRLAQLGLSRRAFSRAWSELLERAGAKPAQTWEADLPEDELPRLKRRIDQCLTARGGEVSARARAAELGRAYLSLDDTGRRRFLALLARDYGPDRAQLTRAASALAQAKPEEFHRARAALARAMVSPRLSLLKQFNGLDQGVKFLVDLRADLLALPNPDAELVALENELHDLLSGWFDVGFLTLRKITWNAPAALLEKLVAYEAVHEIRSWEDLKNRLDSDRRCYAFFHPAMPDEPLIFVEVALVDGLAGNVQLLLDETAPHTDPEQADTAIFYSISNAQKGLQGVAFGDFLIKRVVDELRHDLPNLKTFATLSPIPGFRRWLKERAGQAPPLFRADEAQLLAALSSGKEPAAALTSLLERPGWATDASLATALAPLLTRLCALYLAREKRPARQPTAPGRAIDPVAHFHLTNGARIERINWLADMSPNGIAQSAGLMVNYLYRLPEIESNHERYRAEGKIALSPVVRGLL